MMMPPSYDEGLVEAQMECTCSNSLPTPVSPCVYPHKIVLFSFALIRDHHDGILDPDKHPSALQCHVLRRVLLSTAVAPVESGSGRRAQVELLVELAVVLLGLLGWPRHAKGYVLRL